MPKYLMRGELTSEAIAAVISNPQNRAEVLKKITEAAGGKFECYYYEADSNTVFTITELPDQKTATTLAMATFAGGAIKSYTVTEIFAAEQALEIFRNAGSVDYQPPSA